MHVLNGIRCISQHIYCYMKLWSYDESVHGKFVISTSRLLSRASLNAETDWQVTLGGCSLEIETSLTFLWQDQCSGSRNVLYLFSCTDNDAIFMHV